LSERDPRGELRALIYGEMPHRRSDAPEPDLLIVLAAQLPAGVVPYAMLAVGSPPWPRLPARSLLRQRALGAIAERLEGVVVEADVWERVLPEFAAFLPAALHELALASIDGVEDDEFRARVLAGLSLAVADRGRAADFERSARRHAAAIGGERHRAAVIAAVDDLLALPEPGLADPSSEALAAAASAAERLRSLPEEERGDLLLGVVLSIGQKLGGFGDAVQTWGEDVEFDEGPGLHERLDDGHPQAALEGEGGAGDAASTLHEPEAEPAAPIRNELAKEAPGPDPLWADRLEPEYLGEGEEEGEEEPVPPEQEPAPTPRQLQIPSSAPPPSPTIRRRVGGAPSVGISIPSVRRRRRPAERAGEHAVNTGFASLGRPARFLTSNSSLRRGRDYWFCVEIGRPLKRSLEHSLLPTELLPKEARLQVAVFGFPGELAIDSDHDRGELQLLGSRVVVVREQPTAKLARVSRDLVDRRLFFPIRTPNRSGRFRLRLNIYCAGMLVQSRLVTAEVAAARLPRRRGLRAELEYTISEAIEADVLSELPPHKLSLMLNGPGDASHSFRVWADDGSERLKEDSTFTEGELTDLITTARAALREASWGDRDEWAKGKRFRYGDDELDLENLRLDLVQLAIVGYRIYTLLVDGFRGATIPADFERFMAAPGYVQLAAQDSRMLVPLALFYDYAPFDTTARLSKYTLCEVFVEALRTPGSVATLACLNGACPHRGEDTVVCPSGFWGYRHFLGLPLSSTLDLKAYLTRERPARVVFGSAADLERGAAHEERLGQLGAAMTSGHTRAALLERLRTDAVQLVYLYCHGGLDGTQPYLLVGSGDDGPITGDYLYGRVEWTEARPLVVINGCHTTAVRPDQAFNLVSGFIQQAHALGVVGTEVTIGESLACAFGEEFVRRFAAGDETVGQATRNSRLALLARGNPLGLVYTPFALAGLRMTGT
jgi:hypothetical protein